MIVNENSEIHESKGENKDSNVRKGSKLRLVKKKRKRSVLLDTKHEVVDDRGNKEKYNDSKRLIPIPSFTPLEEAEENVHDAMVVVPMMTLKEQDLSNVEKKEPTTNPITTTTKSSTLESSSTSSHSSEFKKDSRTKRLANQEKERNLLHDDLLHQSKHVVCSKIPSVSSTTHYNSRSKTASKSYKLCTLCSTCSCSQGSTLTSLEQNALQEQSKSKYMPLGLARTDAEIERTLIGRLARLEKSASWFDSLCTKVSKELKRHRRNIMERRNTTIHKNHMKKTNVFLQDADDIDHDMDTVMGASSLSKSLVNRAMNKAFTFRKKHQPTLTQMLEGDDDASNKEEEDDNNNDHDDDHDRHIENETIHPTSWMDMECQDLDTSTMKNNNKDILKELLLKDDSMHHDHVEDVLAEEETEHSYDLHLNVASYRGKAKNLWTASKLSKENFLPYHLYDVNIPDMNELDTKISICDYDQKEDGLLELLNVFETANSHGEESTCNKSEMEGNGFFHDANDMLQRNRSLSLQNQEVNMSQLSPLAKSIYKTMVSNIESEPLKLSVLEEVFPSWKENQRFVLCQNSEDLKSALQNVQSQRTRIEKMIEALAKRNTALQLFEEAINRAMERYANYDSQTILEGNTFPS